MVAIGNVDCLPKEGDPLRLYKEAFRIARNGQSIFAYFDHAFSPRYAYGWPADSIRLAAHSDLLAFFRSETGAGAPRKRPLFMSESDCLDFIALKSESNVVQATDGQHFMIEGPSSGRLNLAVGFKGRWWPAGRPVGP